MKEVLLSFVEVDTITKCWNWTGPSLRGKPYLIIKRKHKSARRVCFEEFVGEIFEDSIRCTSSCLNNKCINPDHTELKLRNSAILKGEICKNGHSKEDAYLCTRKSGRKFRRCKKCDQMWKKSAKKKRETV